MLPNRRTFERPPLVTVAAIAWCVIVFLGINTAQGDGWSQVAKFGYLPELAVFKGAYWGLVSTAFVHVEPIHLLFNMYWLWILGGALERRLGIGLYIAFILCAAVVSSGLQLATGSLGIGFSGVGYALFGFGWMSRTRYPEFARLVGDQTVRMFIGWGILCVVLTYAHVWHIANAAHLGGALFGATLGMFVSQPSSRSTSTITMALLATVSIVPLFYNPMSGDWLSLQAARSLGARDYPAAERFIRLGLAKEVDSVWSWSQLARIGALTKNQALIREAASHLQPPGEAEDKPEAYDPRSEG